MAKSVMTQVDGTTHLRIDKVVDSSQLLVTLSRNGKEWLSPKGWVKQEKGTLLDCQAKKDHTIVEIPGEFAGKIKKGDTIQLKSRELKLEASLDWGQSARAPLTTAKKANGATPLDALSLAESEKRAKDAEKTAAEYRAQMEAASKAREAAQAAALDAARKADEALKAEADRIAEMERAAKAFEEAERTRMEEQRRLERERRLEEERKAEEARLAEEARVQAEAEKLKKERTEARKFFKGQISQTKSEKARLKDVLAGFNAKKESAEAEISDGDKRLNRLEKTLSRAQSDEAGNKAALKREENKIGELKSIKSRVQSSIQDLEKGNEKIFKSLERAESAHEKAIKEVEAAKMRAAEALKTLSGVKAETDKIKSQRETLELERRDADTKISAHEKLLGDLKSAHESSRQAVEKEQSGLKILRKSKDDLAQKLAGVKTDISRTLQDIRSTDDTLKRQQTSLKQIEDMENADDIRSLARQTGAPASKPKSAGKVKSPPAGATNPKIAKQGSEEKGGFLRRFFSRSGQDNVPAGQTLDAKMNRPVPPRPVAARTEAPKSKTAEPEIDFSVPTAKPSPHRENGSGYRLNSWLLMGIAATSVIALGSAYALNSKSDTVATKATSPGETVAVNKAEGDIKPIQVAGLSPVSVPLVSKLDEEVSSIEAAPEQAKISDKSPETTKATTKPVVANEAKPVKVATKTKPKSKAVVKPKPVRAPAASSERNYEAATTQVQEQLNFLGFYNGPIDGQQTQQTQKAMREFKTLYGLTVDNSLSGEFLNTLKRSHDEQIELRSYSSNDSTVIQVVENTASVPTLNSQLAISATSLDSGTTISVEDQLFEAVPGAVVSEPEISVPSKADITSKPAQAVQEAALTVSKPSTIINTPVEDVIVPAKVIRKARIEYPRRLLRQDKLYDAKVFVTYDVDPDGNVVDPFIESVQFEGSQNHKELFERAAIKAVKAQRFSPRTVNGATKTEEARTTRIWFTAE